MIQHWDDSQSCGSLADSGGSRGAWSAGASTDDGTARRISRTDHFVRRRVTLDAIDCSHAWHHAADSEHLARPVCPRGFGWIEQ